MSVAAGAGAAAPARPVLRDARVTRNEPVVPGGAILTLAVEGTFPPPHAGQFVHVRLGSGPLLRRPFSVLRYTPAADPEREGGATPGGPSIELMYAVVGAGTALLADLARGDRLNLLGPLGNAFELGGTGALVLVAGGRGAVPLYRLLETPAAGGREAAFLFGARSADYLWGLERLDGRAGLRTRLATLDGSAGERGTVIDLLAGELERRRPGGDGGGDRELEPERGDLRVLACGPERMLRRVAEVAAAHGVESQVALENQMGCAIGVCRGCVIPRRRTAASPWRRDGNARYATVCKEGPVFLGAEVDWEALEPAAQTVPRGSATL